MPAQVTWFRSTLLVGVVALLILFGVTRAEAVEAPVNLGTAASFAVLAGSTVTNTGPSLISGDLGVSPGSAVTGFPPGIVSNGTINPANALAAQAQADLITAYNDAASRSPSTSLPADLAGLTLVSGVYSGPTLGLTGTLTLDAQNDPNAVFIFQAGSTLITATNSIVMLINGANPCNVFWQVGSSATLETTSVFVGTVLALTSVTVNTGARVEGRLLSRNGAVTLDTNVVTRPACSVTPPTTAPPTTAPTTTAPTTTAPTTTAPTTTGSPTSGSPTSGSPTSGPPRNAPPTLASTGSNLAPAVAVGLLMTGLGSVLVVAARRPKR